MKMRGGEGKWGAGKRCRAEGDLPATWLEAHLTEQGQLETQKRSTAWFRMRTCTIIWWPGGESATLYYGMASSILSSFTN